MNVGAKCHHAKHFYAKCHYGDCTVSNVICLMPQVQNFKWSNDIMSNDIMSNDIMSNDIMSNDIMSNEIMQIV
jgi:hypothetical protein